MLEISAKRTVLTETYEILSSIYEVVKDTIEDYTISGCEDCNMILPQNLGCGNFS